MMLTTSLTVFCIGLLVALAGGAFGASIGANYGFILTGFVVLASWGIVVATGSTFSLDYIAFGPFMGPHIVFAGGVAAAIYAAYKGHMDNGKDVNSPLAGLGKPSVLWVGALFGAGGHIVQIAITYIPWFGSHTDSIALTVLLSGITARLLFGGLPGKGLFKGSLHNLKGRSGTFAQKIAPSDDFGSQWLRWQEKPGQLSAIGLSFGTAAGAVSLVLASMVSSSLTARGLDGSVAISSANTFAFGISAVIILFLITNRNMPVQHHATNIAGLAAIQFFPIVGGSFTATEGLGAWFHANESAVLITLVISAIAGVVTMFAGECFARIWHSRGTSHIDPPAAAIWICNTAVVSLAALFA
ncbi:hypothetical protein [Schaalia sp. lx-100]|uniref:hypothetical protein n=1 Tax=Schaalia sp. lx-100 TaxID=2899081 RepID=UPI001E461734|nr:hypothetical protein [Schaalia sp. lx-100]MCD4557217.1 hypothetical protein [Schaalia sp. lx-100]